MSDLVEQRDIALEDELRDILTRQIESDDDFEVPHGKTYRGVAKVIADRAAEHFMLAIQQHRAAELTRLRALNAELVASNETVHELYRRVVGIADALLRQINPHTDLAEGPAQLYLSLRDQISIHGPAALTRAGGSHAACPLPDHSPNLRSET